MNCEHGVNFVRRERFNGSFTLVSMKTLSLSLSVIVVDKQIPMHMCKYTNLCKHTHHMCI